VLPIDHTHGKFKGPIEKLKEMLDSKEVDPNQRDVMNLTPLMKAAARGYTEAAKMLLDYGAEIDATDNIGYTALRKAEDAKYGGPYTETAELLRSRGAKDVPLAREKRFRYDPSGKSYWTWAEDENGKKYEYVEDNTIYPNWEACTEEVEPPDYLGTTKAELDKKNEEYKKWQAEYKKECAEKRRKEKEEKEAAEAAQNQQQQALAALIAGLAGQAQAAK